MNKHSSKTDGISYEPWFEIIEKLCREKGVSLDRHDALLYSLYHDNCTANEVYHHLRIRTALSAHIEIKWHDKYGHESVLLSNNDSIRSFYKVNPRIKEVMESKTYKSKR